MSTSNTIEYHPEPLVGTVTVQQGSTGIVITVRPSLRRLLLALTPALALLLFAVGLLAAMQWEASKSGTSRLGPAAFLLLLAGAAIVLGLTRTWPLMFPISFEVTADNLVGRWRKLAEVKSFVWPRAMIAGVRADRLRLKWSILKRLCLVVHHREIGEIVVLHGARNELEIIADRLRRSMNLVNAISPGLADPKPPGCRFRPQKWRDGVNIFVPPPWSKLLTLLFLTIGGGVGWEAMRWLGRYIDEDTVYVPKAAGYAEAALAVIIAVIVGANLSAATGKLRRKIAVAADSKMLYVIETGLFHPVNLQWNRSDATLVVQAEPDRHEFGALLIKPQQGGEIILLAGERVTDLQWLANTIQAVRTAPLIGDQ